MSKKFTAVWFVLSALLISASAAAPLPFSKIKVDAEFYPAPVSSAKGGGVSYGVMIKNHTVNKWLMIKVEFTPALEKETFSSFGQGGQIITRGWQDNVVLSVRVLFNSGLVHKKQPVYGLFSGICSFWTIRQDGQKHTVLMFVPAQLIDRYCIANNGGGLIRAMNKKDFFIEAVFSADGTIAGYGYCNLPLAKPAQQKAQFEQMLKSVPGDLRIENSVLPRSKTPWDGYYPDAFDLEKDLTPTNSSTK